MRRITQKVRHILLDPGDDGYGCFNELRWKKQLIYGDIIFYIDSVTDDLS